MILHKGHCEEHSKHSAKCEECIESINLVTYGDLSNADDEDLIEAREELMDYCETGRARINIKGGNVTMITVSRPIGGISINGDEYLLKANGELLEFVTVEEAQAYLVASGARQEDMELYNFHGVKNKSAQALGRIKTEKKAQSSRENGKKGGRPKKQQNT